MIVGIAQTRAAFLRVETEMRLAAPIAARAGATAVARNAAALAPRHTGQTANSMTVSSDGNTASAGPTTPWARFPEYGTQYMPGQHYMERAADASRGEIITAMIAIFRAAIH